MTKKIKKVETKLYGVSKAYNNGNRFEGFSCLHPNEDAAVEEAKRLAQKENMVFVVVELITAAVPGERPVKMTAPWQLTGIIERDEIPF